MARIWKEQRKRNRWEGSWDRIASPMRVGDFGNSTDNLLDEWAYFVKVCGFTFEFWSVEQIEQALAYYKQKTHPSTRVEQNLPGQHEEAQRWYTRVPPYLLKGGKREKVVAALTGAVARFADDRATGGVS